MAAVGPRGFPLLFQWVSGEMMVNGKNIGCVCTGVFAGSLCAPSSVPVFDGEEDLLGSG